MSRSNGSTSRNGQQQARHQADDSLPVASTSQLPLFEMSSQFRIWRYSVRSLEKARADLNATAVSRVRSMLQEQDELEVDSKSAPASNKADVQYLTVSDELSLVAYYLAQLVRLCKAFKFPLPVESTAMTYLKRFYLRNTCMDYHPKNVMLTCLFLATKTENSNISIDAFTSKIPKCSPSDVLSLEFLVAQSLKFQFKVHHADLAGRGMMFDMQTLLDHDDNIAHLTDTTHPKASSTILLLRLTDAEFLYTPSQIALAAFHLADPSLTERWLSHKLSLPASSTLIKDPPAFSTTLADLLRDVIDPLVALVEQGKKAVDVDAVREVDKRLRFCKNPEKDPESSLYQKRIREKEAEENKKRERKFNDLKLKEEEEDPFN